MSIVTLPLVGSSFVPEVPVRIGVPDTRRQAMQRAGLDIPPDIQLRALWDSGCSRLCISESLVQELKLIPTAVMDQVTAAGVREVPAYDISLHVSFPDGPLRIRCLQRVTTHNLPANYPWQVLLGRTAIMESLFQFDLTSRRLLIAT